MTEIKIIFRFGIGENVYPSIEQFVESEKEINFISRDKFNIFLKSDNPIAVKINHCINQGELIPSELDSPLFMEFISENCINIFTIFLGSFERFKIFEKFIQGKNYSLTDIIYLKLNDVEKLTEFAKQKYSKIYGDTDFLKQEIEAYTLRIEKVLNYAKGKYNIIIDDFFVEKVTI